MSKELIITIPIHDDETSSTEAKRGAQDAAYRFFCLEVAHIPVQAVPDGRFELSAHRGQFGRFEVIETPDGMDTPSFRLKMAEIEIRANLDANGNYGDMGARAYAFYAIAMGKDPAQVQEWAARATAEFEDEDFRPYTSEQNNGGQ